MSLRLSDDMVLHNIASSSSFFPFRSDFLAFFARVSYFKFLESKEFNKTIIPFALVGYVTGYSQLAATRLVPPSPTIPWDNTVVQNIVAPEVPTAGNSKHPEGT